MYHFYYFSYICLITLLRLHCEESADYIDKKKKKSHTSFDKSMGLPDVGNNNSFLIAWLFSLDFGRPKYFGTYHMPSTYR